MKIEILKPTVASPCSTPYGIIDKNFSARAKIRKTDDFYFEYEIEVVTSEMAGKRPLGIFITRFTIVMDPKSDRGVNRTLLRDIEVNGLLEATIREAIYPGSQKAQFQKFAKEGAVTPKQLRAAQIIMDNRGESHAKLLMEEFGITEGSARNLKTRVMKLGLIPNSYVEPEPVSLAQMSQEGDYISAVLSGKKPPIAPSQRKSLQSKKIEPNKRGR